MTKYTFISEVTGRIDEGGNTFVIVERGDDRWQEFINAKPAPYIAPTAIDPLIAERAAMTVSRFQAMAALMDAGLLGDVNTALADAGPLAQLAWAEATEFHRNSTTIAGMAAGLGLSDTQIDDLFRAAMLIRA